MNQNLLLQTEVQNYIIANLNTDLHSLLLKKSSFPEVTMLEIVQQIKGLKTARKKFPFLLKEGIIFPPQLNLEQASSENTAVYKADFLEGERFIDLTCGFGIDAYHLSKNFKNVSLVEKNSGLLEIVQHNWDILGRKANFINDNLENFLAENTEKFDLIYLDPARRDHNKNKVFLLEDLSPNILDIQEKLLETGNVSIIKLSPLIDLKYLVSEVKNIFKIDILAVKNDVKEIVIYISAENHDQIKCSCVNLESDEADFLFEYGAEEKLKSEISDPEKYIYIPNNTVLKAGVFNMTAERFSLKKLHANTHIYTSERIEENFPGRIFEMKEISGKEIKKKEKFNIISKNYPMKPEEIKKKYVITDGGDQYIIFTQSKKGKIILKTV